MFDQVDEPKKAPRVSTAMSLGILAVYLVGAFGGFLLFIALGGKPFGTQIATVIAYTYFAFWYIFFPTGGLETQYSLRDQMVQRQIPRLLVIHFAFLILIVLCQTVLLTMKPRLPDYWFKGHGKQGDTLYEGAWIVAPVVVFFTQVLVSRRILSRSLKEDLDKLDSE